MKKRKKTVTPGASRSPAARRSATPRSSATPVGSRPAPRARSLALEGECMVSEAAALKSRLARLISERRPVALDIGRVERVDTAGMQLIAAFVRDRRRQGLAIEWHGRSATLSAAARLLGLDSLLELPP